MLIALAVAWVLGVLLAWAARAVRRERVHQAEPFVGGERAAPESVLVPNGVVYAEYLGMAVAVASAIGFLIVWL